MLKTTRSSDSTQRDNDDEIVGGGYNKNLSTSKKIEKRKVRNSDTYWSYERIYIPNLWR